MRPARSARSGPCARPDHSTRPAFAATPRDSDTGDPAGFAAYLTVPCPEPVPRATGSQRSSRSAARRAGPAESGGSSHVVVAGVGLAPARSGRGSRRRAAVRRRSSWRTLDGGRRRRRRRTAGSTASRASRSGCRAGPWRRQAGSARPLVLGLLLDEPVLEPAVLRLEGRHLLLKLFVLELELADARLERAHGRLSGEDRPRPGSRRARPARATIGRVRPVIVARILSPELVPARPRRPSPVLAA